MMESHELGLTPKIFVWVNIFKTPLYNPSTGEARAGILKVQGQPGKHKKTLSQRDGGGTSP